MSNLALINTGDTSLDKIYASFINDIELSATNKKIKTRLLKVWSLRLKYPTVKSAVKAYKKDTGLNRAQFFRDSKRADILFGNLLEIDAKAKKAIYGEYVLQFYKDCKKADDRDNTAKALKLLGDTWGANSAESLGYNPEKLANPTLKLSIDRNSRELLIAALTTGKADFNKVVDAEALIVESNE